MKRLFAFLIIVTLICFIRSVNTSNNFRVREIAALEEIALNLGEVSMSIDNVVALKDEIMFDLEENLPEWAWKGEK